MLGRQNSTNVRLKHEYPDKITRYQSKLIIEQEFISCLELRIVSKM